MSDDEWVEPEATVMQKIGHVLVGLPFLAWGAFIFYPLLPLLVVVGAFALIMAGIEHMKGGN